MITTSTDVFGLLQSGADRGAQESATSIVLGMGASAVDPLISNINSQRGLSAKLREVAVALYKAIPAPEASRLLGGMLDFAAKQERSHVNGKWAGPADEVLLFCRDCGAPDTVVVPWFLRKLQAFDRQVAAGQNEHGSICDSRSASSLFSGFTSAPEPDVDQLGYLFSTAKSRETRYQAGRALVALNGLAAPAAQYLPGIIWKGFDDGALAAQIAENLADERALDTLAKSLDSLCRKEGKDALWGNESFFLSGLAVLAKLGRFTERFVYRLLTHAVGAGNSYEKCQQIAIVAGANAIPTLANRFTWHREELSAEDRIAASWLGDIGKSLDRPDKYPRRDAARQALETYEHNIWTYLERNIPELCRPFTRVVARITPAYRVQQKMDALTPFVLEEGARVLGTFLDVNVVANDSEDGITDEDRTNSERALGMYETLLKSKNPQIRELAVWAANFVTRPVEKVGICLIARYMDEVWLVRVIALRTALGLLAKQANLNGSEMTILDPSVRQRMGYVLENLGTVLKSCPADDPAATPELLAWAIGWMVNFHPAEDPRLPSRAAARIVERRAQRKQ